MQRVDYINAGLYARYLYEWSIEYKLPFIQYSIERVGRYRTEVDGMQPLGKKPETIMTRRCASTRFAVVERTEIVSKLSPKFSSRLTYDQNFEWVTEQ